MEMGTPSSGIPDDLKRNDRDFKPSNRNPPRKPHPALTAMPSLGESKPNNYNKPAYSGRPNTKGDFITKADPNCSYCKYLQSQGEGKDYFENHTFLQSTDKPVRTQCPNYPPHGAKNRNRVIAAAKLCRFCIGPMESSHPKNGECLTQRQRERHVCPICMKNRVENCIAHSTSEENKKMLEIKSKGIKRGGNHLVMHVTHQA